MNPNEAATNYIVSAKHVLFPDPTEKGAGAVPILERNMGDPNGPTTFADVCVYADWQRWKLNFWRSPLDIGFAKLRNGVSHLNSVNHTDIGERFVRLASKAEYGVIARGEKIYVLGQYGVFGSEIISHNDDIPYQLKDEFGIITLHMSGSFTVSHVNPEAAQPGNSGGLAVGTVRVGEDVQNIAFGILVAADAGSKTNEGNREARTLVVFQPIIFASDEFARAIGYDEVNRPSIAVEGEAMDGLSESRHSAVDNSPLKVAHLNRTNMLRSQMEAFLGEGNTVTADMIEAIRVEIRKRGGYVVKSFVTHRDGKEVLELHLANKKLSQDLTEFAAMSDISLDLITGQRMFRA